MEANKYIDSTATNAKQSEVTILVRQGSTKPQAEIKQSESKATPMTQKWVVSNVQLPPTSIISEPPIITYALHPSVTQFTRTLAEIKGVRCIVAEDTEGQIIHFSTFAEPLTDQTRDAVYAAEAKLIEQYPDQVFDFHLRSAARTDAGTPTPIPGQHFFAVWGSLDEKSGRASQAGQE
jgi:hypothetical protein